MGGVFFAPDSIQGPVHSLREWLFPFPKLTLRRGVPFITIFLLASCFPLLSLVYCKKAVAVCMILAGNNTIL